MTRSIAGALALVALLELTTSVGAVGPSQRAPGNSPLATPNQTASDTLMIGDISRFSRREEWELIVGTFEGTQHLLEHKYRSNTYVDISDVRHMASLPPNANVVVDPYNKTRGLSDISTAIHDAADDFSVSADSIDDFAEISSDDFGDDKPASTITNQAFWDRECINLPSIVSVMNRAGDRYSFVPIIKDQDYNELCGINVEKGWGVPGKYVSLGAVDEFIEIGTSIYIMINGIGRSYIIEIPRSMNSLRSMRTNGSFMTADKYLTLVSDVLRRNGVRYAEAPTRGELADDFLQKRKLSAPYLITVDVEQALDRYVKSYGGQ